MNIGHQLHPSFFFSSFLSLSPPPFFCHQSSSSDLEEVAKAHDIKTDGFITLFPVFTMDLLGVILLETGISLLLFTFSFIVMFLQRDLWQLFPVSTIVLSSFHQFRPVQRGRYDLLRTGRRKAKIVYDVFWSWRQWTQICDMDRSTWWKSGCVWSGRSWFTRKDCGQIIRH